MGTRMLASRESAVHANFKEAIVAADDAGTVLLDVPGNPTMRVLRTGLARRVAADDATPLLGGVTTLYFDGDMDASVATRVRCPHASSGDPPGRRNNPQHLGGREGGRWVSRGAARLAAGSRSAVQA